MSNNRVKKQQGRGPCFLCDLSSGARGATTTEASCPPAGISLLYKELEEFCGVGNGEDALLRGGYLQNLLEMKCTLCIPCFRKVEQALSSKRQVDKVEYHVRQLQKELMVQLNNLKRVIDKFHGTIKSIQESMEAEESRSQKGGKDGGGGGGSQRNTKDRRVHAQFKNIVRRSLKFCQQRKVRKELDIVPPTSRSNHPGSNSNADWPSEQLFSNEKRPDAFPPASVVKVENDMTASYAEEEGSDGGSSFIDHMKSDLSEMDIDNLTNELSAPEASDDDNERWSPSEQAEDDDFDESQEETIRHGASSSVHSKRQRLSGDVVRFSKMGDFKRKVVGRALIVNRIWKKKSGDLDDDAAAEVERMSIKYNNKDDKLHVAHIEIRVNEQQKSLECTECKFKAVLSNRQGNVTSTNQKMEDHIRSVHLDDGMQCVPCGMKIASLLKYWEHMRGHRNAYKCEICERPLLNSAALRIHKWTHFSEEEKQQALATGKREPRKRANPVQGKPFQCSTCGAPFKLKGALKFHEETHLGKDRPMMVCPICGKMMTQRSYLYTHTWRCRPEGEDSPRVKCLACDKTYKTMMEMRGHFNWVHGNKKGKHQQRARSHPCRLCEKSFRSEPGLRRHSQKVHSDAAPYDSSY